MLVSVLCNSFIISISESNSQHKFINYKLQIPNYTIFSPGNVGNGQARHTPAVNPAVNTAVYKSDSKVDLTFDTLEGAINHNNPQLKILLQFLLEKSPFKDKQVGLNY